MGLQQNELQAIFQQAFIPDVHSALNSLFSAADAAVLKLACESQSNKEQNRYFEAAQSLRIVRFGIIESFTQYVLHADSTGLSDQDHTESLRRLLSIRPEEFAANSSLAAALLDLQQRLQSVADATSNPLNPEHFVDSFLQSLSQANIDVHTKMLVLRMFESQLYKKLESFVRATNQLLADNGVLPELESQPTDIQASMQQLVDTALGANSASQSSPLEHALAELQVNDAERLYAITESADPQQAWQKFATVRDLLAELKAANLMPEVLSSRGKTLLDKIPLVAKIFQSLLENQNLPGVAKNMLLALQLPYTRIALEDERFFLQANHPARTLLKEAVRLAEQWQPNDGDLTQDKLYEKLLYMIQNFIEAERTETIAFQSMQFELLAYAETVRQKQVRAEQRLSDSEYGAQASEMARVEVHNLLQLKMQQQQLPFAAAKLLQEAWSHVLYLKALKKGVGSEAWRQSVAVVDQLLASFQPAGDYVSRSDLLVKLPALLRALREGLVSINMSNDVIDGLFSELEEAHKALAVAIGGGAKVDTTEILKQTAKAQVKKPAAVDVTEPVDNAAKLEQEETAQLAMQLILDALRPGILLKWQRPEGLLRCRLAAIIKHTKKYILTDRSGNKIAELLDREIAAKLHSKEIVPVDNGLGFEKTLESVIGSMRGNK